MQKKWLWSLVSLPLLYVGRKFKNDPQFGGTPSGDYLERLKASRHWKMGQFRNLDKTPIREDFISLLGDLMGYIKAKDTFPSTPLPAYVDPPDFKIEAKRTYLTWYGHSALRLETNNQLILLDPMLGAWCAPVPFLGHRFPYAKQVVPKFERIDLIVFSHDHYDHLDYDTVKKLAPRTDHFLVPLGVGIHLQAWGVPTKKITELDWWESTVYKGVTYTFVPARHFGGRSPSSRNRSLWGGYVIETNSKKIFFGGDSGYGRHFKEIGERLGPFDLTMLDCAQYHDRWKNVHMQPEEALQAHQDLGGKSLLPIHWAGFTLSDHAWYDPIKRLQHAADQSGDHIVTPCIGERFSLEEMVLVNPGWWRKGKSS